MIPRVAGKGTSFKGAGLYYLHDKDALSSDRVAYTETVNLPTDDPDLAIKMMAYTAMHQQQIKAANDTPATGRKLAKPVYAYSLSWAPDQEPTQEDMLEAAKETLELLELAEHEALFVIHNDTEHPHIHVIANRVHPDTGIAAKLSKDHIKLSRWAERVEREHGDIRCEQRVENNKRRDKGEFVKDTKSLTMKEFRQWRKARLDSAQARRGIEADNLSATHKGQRQALYDARKRIIKARIADLKEEHRPKWRDLYAQQRQEKKDLEAANSSAVAKLFYVIKNTDLVDPNFKGAMKAIFSKDSLANKLAEKHERQRKELGDKVNERRNNAVEKITKHNKQELDKLKEKQREESRLLSRAHSDESKTLAREIAQGKDVDIFASEKGVTVSEEFRKRAADRAKRRRKRDEQQRDKGIDRERD
jgi:hypothetical protein